MNLKLVATTRVYRNIGSVDFPMWRCIDGNEYIVSRFDHEPTWHEVGEAIIKFQHMIEGQLAEDVREIYAGFELYNNESLTHNENFQLINGGTIDFQAKDVTEIDVQEELDGIKGL